MPGLPRLPFERSDPLEVSPAYAELRATAPIAKVLTAAGDEAWLVTGYEEIRQIFADPRFGRSHPVPEDAPRLSNSALIGGPVGDYATEEEMHTKLRRLLAPAFSARRMAALSVRIQGLVDDLLGRMAEQGPPCDLHACLSVPLPVQVICELLGVPYEDRDRFRGIAVEMTDLSDPERSAAAMREMNEYTYEIVKAKRENPAEDVYSELAAADLPEEEIAMIAGGLLFAGHETTVNQIDYGVLLLLRNPGELDALRRDPSLAPGAVEEIMRMAVPSQHGLLRYAHADVEVGGVRIKRGDLVVLATFAANRDPRVYPDPERFDIRRETTHPHVGFGYGAHYCLGASLARVELQAVFGTLFRRFPELRLAVPYESLSRRAGALTEGFSELPVTW
ncbi:cytochrome P450 [Thermobispora bispora]|uniref:Cytochrome P450 n=1 Tax=Thermobispora bispora (strain ATCC 19993 / DSM 43833 / CBS 139.67 / JCM 10125 / KCTC 9307 / NBRC 14880 / R51) TaxID=469371 RepID=D6Y630_THEBD|nr:cytochrome P450 [Thermobispora bispora]ADG89446.1 cytochrome P450 [Thermobispora bispora DSM 43833]MBX6167119.1 cytochrome P450 [Thermobispora bispora]QSI49085.1 cytochrome P450 [Thermobispora bispora]